MAADIDLVALIVTTNAAEHKVSFWNFRFFSTFFVTLLVRGSLQVGLIGV